MATVQDVKQYWDRRPCNIRHSPHPVGTREYFDEVESRKYMVEPHIPAFADFPCWQGKQVLEIGCGIGTDSINFVRNGASLTIVELSSASLAITKRRLAIEGLQASFINGNAEELDQLLPANMKFDLVYSFGVIHHTPCPERVTAAVARHLNPGGEFRLMVYARHSWKVISIYAHYGWREPWNWRTLVPKYSEAEIGSPVSYVYSHREARELLRGFEMVSMTKDHIFPYRVPDYIQYRYVKNWYFRWMPNSWFRWLERWLGSHLLIVAKVA
ncbi:MAG TPA: class I SAM-dependent methyltransferase [Terriglobales bacterium]|nr:class I SAM-dependent methyltransferase [Terriglobales bacterium]